jgi:hypothetical protein
VPPLGDAAALLVIAIASTIHLFFIEHPSSTFVFRRSLVHPLRTHLPSAWSNASAFDTVRDEAVSSSPLLLAPSPTLPGLEIHATCLFGCTFTQPSFSPGFVSLCWRFTSSPANPEPDIHLTIMPVQAARRESTQNAYDKSFNRDPGSYVNDLRGCARAWQKCQRLGSPPLALPLVCIVSYRWAGCQEACSRMRSRAL